MSKSRTKTEINQLIAESASYREDMEFVQETISGKKVFIGQLVAESGAETSAAFCITVGMYQFDLPEVVVSGVPVFVVKDLVDELTEGHDFDREFLSGGRPKLIHDYNVIALPIETPEQHQVLNLCRDFYTLIDKPAFNAVQLVFADERGAFPWTAGYRQEDRESQPLLGVGFGVTSSVGLAQ